MAIVSLSCDASCTSGLCLVNNISLWSVMDDDTLGWVNTLSHCGVPGSPLGNLSKKEGILQNMTRTQFIFILRMRFVHMYVCAPCMCLMSMEVRSGG